MASPPRSMTALRGPSPPLALTRLLTCSGPERDVAWAAFLAAYSRLMLHACRAIVHDRDAAMDGYEYILSALSEDEFRRLRAYVPDGKTRFTTWLAAVLPRLLVDCYRHRYGRLRVHTPASHAAHLMRRRLEDLVGCGVDPDDLAAAAADNAELEICRRELVEALDEALTTLPAADRKVLSMWFEDGRPAREIATVVGFGSEFHVYRRRHAILASLRVSLLRQGFDGADL